MTQIDLIGSSEAADLLGIHRNSLNYHVKRGEITPVARLGKRGIAVFARKDIEDFAESKAVA
ncbi:helix-turn-helix domain-containing protein [Corynebacterium propinquum]|uniref:Helix-turn-helix domain-containing protein n=1 Tax=Corynebacterium propinquum TaxID=43769 RepID=A0AAP4BZJ2_9CORY|nr:helix-turn-helix domain-containing protein [Corynebacterium propinquum]MDK4326177.1 helix-turn-helix domain-containing protein [Corynebacterium propinquum]